MGKKLIRLIVLSVAIIGLAGLISRYLLDNAPTAKRRPVERMAISVEAQPLVRQDYQVLLETYGTVRPRTQGELIPQIAGEIVSLSPNFQDGGFFEADEVLLRIDDRDYAAQVIVAEADLLEAQSRLSEEKARVEQAKRDWERAGRRSHLANALVLRKPQLAAAKAGVLSAEARLTIAKLNLERTKIRAPYAGRVLDKQVDVGQFVSSGKVLGTIYAVDYAEVRLPLNAQQLAYLDLPEPYRDQSTSAEEYPVVELAATIGRKEIAWPGKIIRTEGAIDEQSRQLFVVAQVVDPYGRHRDAQGLLTPPLKVGQFVRAKIQGQTLRDVLVIPRATLYQNNEIILVRERKLLRQSVDVLWQNAEDVVIAGAVVSGDLLATTPMATAVSGTEVDEIIDHRHPAKLSQQNAAVAADGHR